ncbi:phosphotransferase family protein [Aeromicrobium senzhongii]|uniref:Phosphotransferase family protein n=1 Tax=Aeromicrobium senzhongii TaxID=2663859 RepID=A0ABX6SX68_9ACTN|nr:phosphotransferase family protein [Aeromicrobium senzhongii]MTB88142.1 phosphotransferase [Aeromicrobium senzhongii]QNL94865.1 phosphotransferase family protein [Aeromicrobium senzhongii]
MTQLIATEPVARWIASLGIGAEGPIEFRRVGAGQSNLTFLVTDAVGHRWILRRPPLGKLLASAHDVEREHRIMSGLQGTGVPVPAIHGFTKDPAVTDAPIMLMDFVDGRVLDSIEAIETVPQDSRRAIGLSLASTLGSVHAVDLAAAGLADLASHAPYAERQLRRWHRQWEQSRTRDLPIVADLAQRLTAQVPEQREVSLVHGDFHLMNVITDPRAGRVTAVLDWELSTLGDPLADLGGLLAYWPQADDEILTGFQGPTLPGFPSRDELVAQYAKSTGRDVSAIGFWYVLGLWKIAIIAEGVLRRSIDDPRNTAVTGQISSDLIDALLARADLEARAVGL